MLKVESITYLRHTEFRKNILIQKQEEIKIKTRYFKVNSE